MGAVQVCLEGSEHHFWYYDHKLNVFWLLLLRFVVTNIRMSKRQRRIFPKEFPEQLPSLVGSRLQAIDGAGRVLFGHLVSYHSPILRIQDARQHVHQLHVTNVAEVIIDLPATY